MKRIVLLCAALAATLLFGSVAHATRFKGLQAIDKETLVVMFQDGDVRYRDNGTGPSAFLGHTFVDGDDTVELGFFRTAVREMEEGGWDLVQGNARYLEGDRVRMTLPLQQDST